MTEHEWLTSSSPAAMLKHVEGKVSDRKLRLWVCALARRMWSRLTDARSRRAVEIAEQFADGAVSSLTMSEAFRQANMAWPHMGVGSNPAGVGRYSCHPNAAYAAQTITRPGLSDMPSGADAAHILRDIVGNPWRLVVLPKVLSPELQKLRGIVSLLASPAVVDKHASCPWLTPDVKAMAEAAYRERKRKCEDCHGTGNGYHVRDDYINRPPEDFCPPCRGTGTIDDGALDPARLLVLSDALEEAGCDGDLLAHLREPEPHIRGCWAVDLLREAS